MPWVMICVIYVQHEELGNNDEVHVGSLYVPLLSIFPRFDGSVRLHMLGERRIAISESKWQWGTKAGLCDKMNNQ